MGTRTPSAHLRVVDHLLRAIRFAPPGGRLSFFWNPHEPRSSLGTRAYNFYVDQEEVRRASLVLLSAESELLAGTSLDEVRTILLEFFRFHLHLFDADALMDAFRHSERASDFPDLDKDRIASSLYEYIREVTQPKLYLIVAKRLAVSVDCLGTRLLLIRPTEDLNAALPKLPFDLPHLNGRQFPPYARDRAEGVLGDKDCWIGCLARSDQEAYRFLEALLGAVSLVLKQPESRIFSSAESVPYIYCFGGRWLTRLDGPSFPPLISDHIIESQESETLLSLFERTRPAKEQRRLETGLQFAGAGWAPPGRLSFLHNAIAFDALFGEQSKVGASIRTAVERLAASVPSVADRISRLIRIRNALLHGEISTVEASSEYLTYYDLFDCDPQDDQVAILGTCIRELASEP